MNEYLLNDYAFIPFILGLMLCFYIFLYELVQVLIKGFGYFMSFQNLCDFFSLLITIFLFFENNDYFSFIRPFVFLLVWFKLFTCLSVFKPIRYFIQMIFEIVRDISTFLIILLFAIVCHTQISTIILSDEPE